MSLRKSISELYRLSARQNHTKAKVLRFSRVLSGTIPQAYNHVAEINVTKSEEQKDKFNVMMKKALVGGGKKGIERHVLRNKKMLVRDRIKLLLDQNSEALELSVLAGLGMEYSDVPCAGVVTIIGKIHGMWCMVIGNDATVKSGSIYPITLKKQLRAQQIAAENRLPTVHLVDSGGAFLPLQSEIFNPGGRIFYNEANMSAAGIPQVAVVCGSCTAGAAYIPAMADEAIILDKIGTIFLGGPPLVQAATGEKVTAEELGGATLHCQQSGCTDHFATSEETALATARDIIATLNMERDDGSQDFEEPLHDISLLNSLAPSHAFGYQLDPRHMLACIVDGSSFHEFKETFGTTLVTGFGRVKGHLAGFVANYGRLTGPAALKGAHFVQLCSQRNIPLIFLQHFVDDPRRSAAAASDPDIEAEVSASIKGSAQLMQAVACCDVPSLTLTTGGLTGTLESHALGSLSMGSRFHFVYPSVRVGAHDPVYLARNLSEAQTPSATGRVAALFDQHCRETESYYAAARMFNDGVILPEHTREVLAQCLSVFRQEATAFRNYRRETEQRQTNFRM